uniref:Telomeric repeat-binding factor 2-interacting protein 1 n=1 Tax=Poecilia reticulata TaxID=8081 RepID=A0A3P9NIE0_POERE
MSSRQQDPAQSISPVLFLTVEGEPMSFFLRPGPLKQKLQPLITAGGGTLCRVQVPGAILLIDPEENSSVLESDAHRYVSTQYIHDCIKKEEQLNLDDYRLNPKAIQRSSSKLNNSGGSCAGLLGGRIAYTPEEDAAILNFISKRKSETGGNRLWQEMEKQRVTSHSWQSMKSRFKDQLSKNQSASTEVETKEDSNKLTKQKLEASPVQEEPQRRLTRRQLELEAASSSPEPYGKKLRSASSAAEQSTASPPHWKKTKAAVKLTNHRTQVAEEPPHKKSRGKKAEAEVESRVEQISSDAETKTDLVSVTKALLKTSGDFAAAADLLLNPSSVSEPFWSRSDDSLLLSANPVSLQKLQEKYGEENVAKRIVFLEVKG